MVICCNCGFLYFIVLTPASAQPCRARRAQAPRNPARILSTYSLRNEQECGYQIRERVKECGKSHTAAKAPRLLLSSRGAVPSADREGVAVVGEARYSGKQAGRSALCTLPPPLPA